MSIQSNINGMLGTAAGALVAGKHLKQQKMENELKKAELGVELKNEQEAVYKASRALNANSLEVSKEMQKDLDPEVVDNPELDEDSYLDLKQKQALEATRAAMNDFSDRKLKYEMGVQKTKPSSKRFDMAHKAFLEATDAVEARRQLSYNLDMAKRKVGITRAAWEGVE